VNVDAGTISARFRRTPYDMQWSAEGVLPDAAVLVHIFDGWEQRNADGSYVMWRAKPGVQTSASLVWADQRPPCCPKIGVPVFTRGQAGVQGMILRPGGTTKVLCGKGSDMSGARCGRQGMWEPQDFGWQLKEQNEYERTKQAPWSGRYDYNEILYAGDHFNAHLPDSVEAFFGGDLARAQHASFLAAYGLSAREVPFVHFNVDNWDVPFE